MIISQTLKPVWSLSKLYESRPAMDSRVSGSVSSMWACFIGGDMLDAAVRRAAERLFLGRGVGGAGLSGVNHH